MRKCSESLPLFNMKNIKLRKNLNWIFSKRSNKMQLQVGYTILMLHLYWSYRTEIVLLEAQR